jgi:hypothetical protein
VGVSNVLVDGDDGDDDERRRATTHDEMTMSVSTVSTQFQWQMCRTKARDVVDVRMRPILSLMILFASVDKDKGYWLPFSIVM